MEKELKIDGRVYDFPIYGATAKDNAEIRTLYEETFHKKSPESASYEDVYEALEISEPIAV